MGPGSALTLVRDDIGSAVVLSRSMGSARRRLPQALPAQAILALQRHRQLGCFLRAPAGAREIAAEFGAAARADEATRFRG